VSDDLGLSCFCNWITLWVLGSFGICVCVYVFFPLAAVAMASSSVVAVAVWWVLLLCCYSQNVEQELRRRILCAKGEELGVV
jgi:hypothetical protein